MRFEHQIENYKSFYCDKYDENYEITYGLEKSCEEVLYELEDFDITLNLFIDEDLDDLEEYE